MVQPSMSVAAGAAGALALPLPVAATAVVVAVGAVVGLVGGGVTLGLGALDEVREQATPKKSPIIITAHRARVTRGRVNAGDLSAAEGPGKVPA